jgi:hypothetical protein
VTIPLAGWVAPFGHPRIKACSRLPVAFRSVPRPSSPPGAKASTKCPYRARDHRIRLRRSQPTMHRNHPQDASVQSGLLSTSGPIEQVRWEPVAQTPLNTAAAAGSLLPVRHCDRGRPETHQNLIHPDKEQRTRPFERVHALPPASYADGQTAAIADFLRDGGFASASTHPSGWWR